MNEQEVDGHTAAILKSASDQLRALGVVLSPNDVDRLFLAINVPLVNHALYHGDGRGTPKGIIG